MVFMESENCYRFKNEFGLRETESLQELAYKY